jgi:HK97 family phage portal protein
MGWIQNLFGRQKSLGLREVSKILAGAAWSDHSLMQQYGKSVYVFGAINKIAQKIAAIDLQLFQIKNSKGEVDELLSHPAIDLLYRCNPFQTKNQFWKITLINKKLTGEAFWLKVRDNRNKVVELWNLRPDLVTIVSDPENYIKHYELQKDDGRPTIIKKEDMVHFQDPNPLDLYRGMSPLKPAQSRIETELHATDFQRNFFLNNARPDALLLSEDNLSSEQKDELKTSWNAKHKGPSRNSRLGILEGGIQYQQIAITQKEMDYIESLDHTRDDILIAFGVPKSIITTDDVNYANGSNGLKSFLSETIIPEMDGLLETINEMLIIPDFGERLYLDYEDPTPADRQMELNEYTAGVDKWITRNEIRQKMNLEPVPGGDDLYLGLGNAPLDPAKSASDLDDDTEDEDATEPPAKEEEPTKVFLGRHGLREKLLFEEQLVDSVTAAIKRTKGTSKKKQATLLKEGPVRKLYGQYVNKKIDGRAKRFRTELAKEAGKQMGRVLAHLTGGKMFAQTKALPDLLSGFDKKKEQKVFTKLALPFLVDAAVDAGQDALDMIQDGQFKLTTALQKALEKRARFFATTVNDTTLEKLSTTLAQGLAAGEGVTELSDRVKAVYEEFSTYRSDMIARTEATAANNEGFLEAYKQSSVVTSVEWVATHDDRTRDEHLALDGEIVAKGEKFSNGLEYPNEPNCRCVISPVI